MQSGQKLLIVADDIEGEALATLVLNKLRGTFNCVAVKAPEFGENRKAVIEDIAILTGGSVVSEDLGLDLKSVPMTSLGRAKMVRVSKEKTVIVGGAGAKSDVDARVGAIKNQLADTKDEYNKEKLSSRLAKLSGGVAVIGVGSATEVELKEKKLRIEDALSATKSASQEGIVAGGGVALLKTIKPLEKLIETLSGDEKTGAQIILKAITAPIRQIAHNAGVDGGVVQMRVLEKIDDPAFGFDALNLEYGDMFARGIIDPTKVTRTALENAASVASSILTTECLVAKTKKENAQNN